jgi:CheY-like chemotaxis protein
VRSIVERHGGRIAVSRPHNERSRFTLTLPIADGTDMKILIVDDDRDLLSLVGFALRQAGYVVVEAADVNAALRVYFDESPELAILDINLPGGSGFAICKAIRAHSGFRS